MQINERDGGGKYLNKQKENNTEGKRGGGKASHTHIRTHGHVLTYLSTYTHYRKEDTYGLELVTEGFLEETILG